MNSPQKIQEANKARLGNPYQPVVTSLVSRSSNINSRFYARSRW